MQPLSRGEGRGQEGARLDIFAKCGILFLFILTGLPGAAGLQKEMSSMKYAFDNANLLDGTKDMRVQPGLCVLTDGGTITDIVPAGTAPAGYTRIDLRGRCLLPGLINMHVHLAGSGKIQKKQRDNEKLVRRILSNPVSRAVAYRMVCGFARDELLGGVTTIRTVGGLSTFDTRLRDEIAVGRRVGPRILAANEGISVPGGHMAGSVAIAAETIDQALAQVDAVHAQGADLVKLMITGGVMDATERGVPGELKMPPEMVRAVCERAHALGYTVAAHTESPEGVRVALENGVDSIEHGAKPDEEILRLFHERGAFLCVTLSPALPYALFDRSVTHLTEVEQFNGNVVFEGMVACAKAALAHDIPIALGNDVGCQWIAQYDFWRELCYFHKYTGASNACALYCATGQAARLAGLGGVTGTLAPGMSADMIVAAGNPLDDLRVLRTLDMVVARGRVIDRPKVRRNAQLDAGLDPLLA